MGGGFIGDGGGKGGGVTKFGRLRGWKSKDHCVAAELGKRSAAGGVVEDEINQWRELFFFLFFFFF